MTVERGGKERCHTVLATGSAISLQETRRKLAVKAYNDLLLASGSSSVLYVGGEATTQDQCKLH